MRSLIGSIGLNQEMCVIFVELIHYFRSSKIFYLLKLSLVVEKLYICSLIKFNT